MDLRRIQPEKCCLIVIDLQEKLMKAIERADEVVRGTVLMINAAKELNVPILPMTQYRKGLGGYVSEIENLLVGIPQYDKMEFNVTANRAVAEAVATLPAQVETFVLVGVESHICVFQTALGLMQLGKHVWVVSDAVSSRKRFLHQEGLELLRAEGASVGPAEMLIYLMLGKAGTPQFKKILPHILAQDKVA